MSACVHVTYTVPGYVGRFASKVNISAAVLQDLLKHTPTGHPDHPLLQDALRISQNFLSSINEETTPRRQSVTVKKGEVSIHTGHTPTTQWPHTRHTPTTHRQHCTGWLINRPDGKVKQQAESVVTASSLQLVFNVFQITIQNISMWFIQTVRHSIMTDGRLKLPMFQPAVSHYQNVFTNIF